MPKHETTKTPIREGAVPTKGMVTIEKGFTVKTGDYESARVTVSITSPVNPTDEDLLQIKRTLKKVDALVDKEIGIQLSAIDDETRDKRK